MWKAAFFLLALLIPLQATASITLSCTLTRTSGNVPLAVWVNCQNTTSTGVTYPWHEIQYKVDFGDTPTTFVNGSRGSLHGDSSANDNVMYGPLAAHVYQSAGTYNISVTATDASGSTTSTSGNWSDASNGQVVTTAFDRTGTNSMCFSTSGTFTSCPTATAGQHITTSSFDTALTDATTGCAGVACKQLYFRGGETFTSATGQSYSTAGPGIMSSFGTGQATISTSVTTASTLLDITGTSDLRFQNLLFQGPAVGGQATQGIKIGAQDTFDNVTMDGWYYAIQGAQQGISQFMFWKGAVTHITGLQNGSDSSYAGYLQADDGSDYIAVVGSSASNTNAAETKTHLWRMESPHHVVYEDNTLENTTGVSTWKTGGIQYTGNANQIANYLIASDNYVTGGSALWGVETGGNCAGCGFVEHIQDVILERNWFTQANQYINIGALRVTARDNLFDCGTCTLGGWSLLIRHFDSATQPLPDYIWVYNNSFERTVNEVGNVCAGNSICDEGSINLGDNSGTGTLGHVFIYNNIYYAPLAPNGYVIRDNTGGSETLSANKNTCGEGNVLEATVTSCVGAMTTDPYTNSASITPTNAKPAAASYPIGAGITVPVYGDFFLTALSGTYDMGAVTTQAAQTDHGHGSFELFGVGWMIVGIGALLSGLLMKGGMKWAHS